MSDYYFDGYDLKWKCPNCGHSNESGDWNELGDVQDAQFDDDCHECDFTVTIAVSGEYEYRLHTMVVNGSEVEAEDTMLRGIRKAGERLRSKQ